MSTLATEYRRAASDLRPLVEFRFSGVHGQRRRTVGVSLLGLVAITVAVAVVPSFLPMARDSQSAVDLALLLPTAYMAFLLTVTLAVIGSGGGRELLPREHAVAFPLSPTTDHLGTLLLAPLNLAWIIQVWALLGATSYVVRPDTLVAVQLNVMLWILAATAIAQAFAWAVEWVRRGKRGALLVRSLWVLLGGTLVVLVATGNLANALDGGPSLILARVIFGSDQLLMAVTGAIGFLVLAAAAVLVGGGLAHAVARRTPKDEAKSESQTFLPRAMPGSDLAALVRIDRASVLRSLPLRRGLIVLALLPGLVAAGGQLRWELLPILPGLVAAGGALLFGINAWCLDGVGALWRDSLPVDPKTAFLARAKVLLEILMVATIGCIAVAGLRAGGLPTSSELAAILATVVVVSMQVVARSMQWSVRHPYAMDLRSARGTPAPPAAMLTYSAWLAFSSTMTGMVFAVTAKIPDPSWAVVIAIPFVLAAVRRFVITLREWSDPPTRARVIATVSAR